MNASQIAALWIAAGGPTGLDTSTNLPIPLLMGAVAIGESSGNISAISPQNKDGSYDYGLFQINSKAWPQYNPGSLINNPTYNAQAAIAVYTTQGITAWNAYNNGSFQNYLPSGAIPIGTANAWPTTTPQSNATPVTNTLAAIFGDYGNWITSTNVNVLYKAMVLCAVLIIAATIRPISKFVIWVAVAILFLLMIQKSNADNVPNPLLSVGNPTYNENIAAGY